MAEFLALENVEEVALRHPDTFFLPSKEERSSQKVGASVRLHFLIKDAPLDGPRAERMWVTVTQKRSWLKPYTGILENMPACIENLQAGDEITFKPCHIAQTLIKQGDPRWIDSTNLKAMVSEMCFEKDEVVRFLYRQKPDRDEDSGWRIFTGHETQEYSDDAANIRLVDVGYMLDRDPSLLEPLRGEAGAVFERTGRNKPWTRVEDWNPED